MNQNHLSPTFRQTIILLDLLQAQSVPEQQHAFWIPLGLYLQGKYHICCNTHRQEHLYQTEKQLQLPQGTIAEIASDLLGNVKLELKLGQMADAKLAVGDTFECALMIESEPLYVGNLIHHTADGGVLGPINYMAGKGSGIIIEVEEP